MYYKANLDQKNGDPHINDDVMIKDIFHIACPFLVDSPHKGAVMMSFDFFGQSEKNVNP